MTAYKLDSAYSYRGALAGGIDGVGKKRNQNSKSSHWKCYWVAASSYLDSLDFVARYISSVPFHLFIFFCRDPDVIKNHLDVSAQTSWKDETLIKTRDVHLNRCVSILNEISLHAVLHILGIFVSV